MAIEKREPDMEWEKVERVRLIERLSLDSVNHNWVIKIHKVFNTAITLENISFDSSGQISFENKKINVRNNTVKTFSEIGKHIGFKKGRRYVDKKKFRTLTKRKRTSEIID